MQSNRVGYSSLKKNSLLASVFFIKATVASAYLMRLLEGPRGVQNGWDLFFWLTGVHCIISLLDEYANNCYAKNENKLTERLAPGSLAILSLYRDPSSLFHSRRELAFNALCVVVAAYKIIYLGISSNKNSDLLNIATIVGSVFLFMLTSKDLENQKKANFGAEPAVRYRS